MTRFHKYFLFLVILAVLFSGCREQGIERPIARKGVIDLSQWDFEEQGIVRLDGEWEFFYNRLLKPEDFDISPPTVSSYFQVPKLWNNYELQLLNQNKIIELTGTGYHTYRILVKINPETDIYGIRIGRVETAYKMWINQKLVVERGETARNPDDMKPKWLPTEIFVDSENKALEIIIAVSNFKHRKGGISQSIYFGTPKQIISHEKQNVGFDFFLLGLLLIMSMYHFGLFVLRRKDLSSLFFGLLCFFTGTHLIVNGEILLAQIFPDFNWEILMKINFVSNFLRLAFFTLFLYALFKKEISRWFMLGITAWAIVMTLFVLVTKARIFTHSLLFFEVVVLITFLYLMYSLIRATIRKREGAIYSIIGTVILLVTAINDILHDSLIIQTAYIVPIGVFIFIFFQSFMLSLRFSKSFVSVEKLTTRLLSLDRIKNEFLASTTYNMANPLKIIVENIGAEKGFLILKKQDDWFLVAQTWVKSKDMNQLIDVPLAKTYTSAGSPLLPQTVIKHVTEKQTRVLFDNAYKNEQFLSDDYIRLYKIKSLLCVPLVHNEELKGVLYLENNSIENAFTNERIHVLDLLSSQIATLIENARIYEEIEALNRTLEQKVRERTTEVHQQKEEITAQRDEIERKNKILERAYNEIISQNKHITDSIKYAERIQKSILPTEGFIKKALPDSFIYMKPKEVLSGDFYWIEQFPPQPKDSDKKPENILVSAVDCTGHGVPGALLSVMANNLLNNAIKEYKYVEPNRILNHLQNGVRAYLRQPKTGRVKLQDGMDMALIRYETSSRLLQFAGAKNPIYIVRNPQSKTEKPVLEEYKGDRFSVGGIDHAKYHNRSFSMHETKLNQGDIIYLCSDGFADQFGGPKGRKFKYSQLKKLLLSIFDKPLSEQRTILDNTIQTWMEGVNQIDDILIIGISF